MHVTFDTKLGFDDILIRPRRTPVSSREQADLYRELRCVHSGRVVRGVPIIAANMDTVGTFGMAHALTSHFGMFTAIHKFVTPGDFDDFVRQLPEENGSNGGVFYTVGVRKQDLQDLIGLHHRELLCLDSPNGYTEPFVDRVKRVRELCPDSFILAGNVATPEMVEALILAGASAVKVGIGSGSACTTRVMTGVGYPQMSAVLECADAAHGIRGHVCSDGGHRVPGDIAKALCGGADFVMLGGMLAGTLECGEALRGHDGEPWTCEGPAFMRYRGMASNEAMKDNYGELSDYRASEGKMVLIPYRGSVVPVVQQILGGVRGCCAFIGARKIKDMPKCATLVRVTEQENMVYGSAFKWWER
jgi:GMP reductase